MTPFTTPSTPNLADYLTFIRQGVGIGPAFLPDNSLWVQASLDMALATVTLALAVFGSPVTGGTSVYTLACYNFAADRLINFALDEAGQSYFKDMRASLGINSFSPGVISSSSDQGTSQTFEVIEVAKRLTITDLQMLKTPYGRIYLDFAQSFGPTPWGLT